MILIKDKKDCCGCEACVQTCPKHCISFYSDNEGFRYPVVNAFACIDCHLCERVCPELNKGALVSHPNTYAAYSLNAEIRKSSSSGGIFSVLSEYVINHGGVVFGARFDNDWSVKHDYTETQDGLMEFRGSKYLQSKIGDNYVKAKVFLEEGRLVLFCGTPCQIAGLKRYLRKAYDNLIAVDFICHGIPSPKIWKSYLDSVNINIEKISFRNKRNGWKNYRIVIQGYDGKEIDEVFFRNVYMKIFLSDLTLRPSCYNCPAKGFTSGSDITLGDFWGIDKIDSDIDDNMGISLLFINNARILEILRQTDVFLKEELYERAIRCNPSVLNSVSEPVYRRFFFKKFEKTANISRTYEAVYSTDIFKRLERRLWLATHRI